jgi:hypothetical protein
MDTPDVNSRASSRRGPQANTPKISVDEQRWECAVKIPPEDWEKHKDTIMVLWQTKSPDNVRKYMMETYGFKATYVSPGQHTLRTILLMNRMAESDSICIDFLSGDTPNEGDSAFPSLMVRLLAGSPLQERIG